MGAKNHCSFYRFEADLKIEDYAPPTAAQLQAIEKATPVYADNGAAVSAEDYNDLYRMLATVQRSSDKNLTAAATTTNSTEITMSSQESNVSATASESQNSELPATAKEALRDPKLKRALKKLYAGVVKLIDDAADIPLAAIEFTRSAQHDFIAWLLDVKHKEDGFIEDDDANGGEDSDESFADDDEDSDGSDDVSESAVDSADADKTEEDDDEEEEEEEESEQPQPKKSKRSRKE